MAAATIQGVTGCGLAVAEDAEVIHAILNFEFWVNADGPIQSKIEDLKWSDSLRLRPAVAELQGRLLLVALEIPGERSHPGIGRRLALVDSDVNL